ncbi:2018_t:CDS:1, partial [Ambispora gerdemannii]
YYAFIPESNINQETVSLKRKWILNTISNNPNFLGLFNPNPKSNGNFRLEFNSTSARNDAISTFIDMGIDSVNTIAISTSKTNKSSNESTDRNGVVILDIPVNMNETTVKLACNSIGSVKDFKCTEKGGWKTAYVSFMEPDEELNLNNTWSIMIKHDSMR